MWWQSISLHYQDKETHSTYLLSGNLRVHNGQATGFPLRHPHPDTFQNQPLSQPQDG